MSLRLARSSNQSGFVIKVWTRFNKELEMTEYDKLKEIVENCSGDIAKFKGGNKAAGTRVRKAMQDVKSQAQAVRQAVLKKREE